MLSHRIHVWDFEYYAIKLHRGYWCPSNGCFQCRMEAALKTLKLKSIEQFSPDFRKWAMVGHLIFDLSVPITDNQFKTHTAAQH